MKKFLTLSLGLLAVASMVEAKTYKVTQWKEYTSAWTAAGINETDVDTILISATDMAGRSLCSDIADATKAGRIYFIGVNDADGKRPQLRSVTGSNKIISLPGTTTTLSLIFENLHFCGTSATDNLMAIEDGSTVGKSTYPINFDTLAFRNCEIEEFRWGLRARATNKGRINCLDFVGNKVHKEVGTSAEFMIFHHRIGMINICNNTFYNLYNVSKNEKDEDVYSASKGLFWMNRLTADDELTQFEFYFENNVMVGGCGTYALFDFGNYVYSGSTVNINNNFIYYPDWESPYYTKLTENTVYDLRKDTIGTWSDGTPRTINHKVDSTQLITKKDSIKNADSLTFTYTYDTTMVYKYDTLGNHIEVKMPTIVKGRNLTVLAQGNVIRSYADWLSGISVDKDGEGKWLNFDGKIDYEVTNAETGATSVKHISGNVIDVLNNYSPAEIGFTSKAWTLPEEGDFTLWKQDPSGTYTKGAQESYIPGMIGPDYWYSDVKKEKCSFSASLSGYTQSATLTVTPKKSQYFTGETVKLVVALNNLNTFKGWSDGSMDLERTITLEGDLHLVATVVEDPYLAVWDFSDYAAKGYKNTFSLGDLKGIAPNYTYLDSIVNIQYMEHNGVDRVKQYSKITPDTTWTDSLKTAIKEIKFDTTWNENFMELRSSKCSNDLKPCFAVKTHLAEYQAKQGHCLMVTFNTLGQTGVEVSALAGTDGYCSKKVLVDYSLDGKTWTNFGSGMIESGQSWFEVKGTLPEAANNQSVVYVRFYGDPEAATDADHLFPYDDDEKEYMTIDQVEYEFWFLTNVKINSYTAQGISTVESAKTVNAPMYDLFGRQMKAAKSGLYIQNGKVIMVK